MKKFAIEKFTASNGLRCLVQQFPGAASVGAALYLTGGSRIETETNQGIGYLTQKVLLKGSRAKSWHEITEELELLGAELKSSSDKDYFNASFKILGKNLERGLALMAESLLEPEFPEREVELERNNLLAEIEKHKDETIKYASELCDRLVFDRHPYRFFLRGEKETVCQLNRADLIEHHRKAFHPENMVLSLSGDLNPEQAKKWAEQYFGAFKGKGKASIAKGNPVHLPKATLKLEEIREKEQLALVIGYPAPAYPSEEFIQFLMLNYALSGMGARFFIELREKLGLAYMVHTLYQPYQLGGVFKLLLGTEPKNLELASQRGLEEIRQVAEKGVTLKELQLGRRYYLGLLEIEKQKNLFHAERSAFYELIGLGHDFLEKLAGLVKHVTLEQINQMGKKYFSYPCSLSLVLPK